MKKCKNKKLIRQKNTKLKICKDTKIQKINDYENTIPQEGQNPHSQSLQMHFRKSLRCNNEVCDPPVLKLKVFTFLKGINFTLQPTVCFNQVLA